MKTINFTDIHFGRNSNDRQSNQDSSDFVDFVIATAKELDIKVCNFLGDWNDNRHTLHVSTLNYSDDNIRKLATYFDQVYFIPGNHDLHYRERRDLNSIPFAKSYPNIKIIEEITQVGNVTYCPWILKHEWILLENINTPYVFGHFEFPNFMMNGKARMPDHGLIDTSQLTKPKYFFSGHYHTRQCVGNIMYIGNVFPQSFSDAWDDNRGVMILDTDKMDEPEFIKWDKAPSYRTMLLSELIEYPHKFLKERSYIRATVDLALLYDELQFIKDMLIQKFQIRKLELVPAGKEIADITYVGSTSGKTVDQSVLDGIEGISVTSMNKESLLEIYQRLIT